MKLSEIAQKPNLIKVELDDEKIVELYGEPLEFWMYDRQDLPTFLKLAQTREDQVELYSVIREMVLDEKGNKVLGSNEILPMQVMVPVIEAVVAKLGNLPKQTLPA